jgi:hypothetical protein
LNVPKLRRRPVFASFLREYKRYSPDFNCRIISTLQEKALWAFHPRWGNAAPPAGCPYACLNRPANLGIHSSQPYVLKTGGLLM